MPYATTLTDGVLNGALADFLNAIQTYFPLLLYWGYRILQAITFIGFGYMTILAVSNQDWFGTFMAFSWGVFRIALVRVVMGHIQDWGPAFPNLGLLVGSTVAGVSPYAITPSGLYDLGLHIVAQLFWARHFASWFNIIADVEFVLLIVVTQVTWCAIGCVWLWTLIEAKWYVAKGPITICFSTFDLTWPILENWVVTLLQVGIRMLTAILIIAIGLILARAWTAGLTVLGLKINVNQVQYGTMQLVEAIILFYAIWTLPNKAAQLIMSKGASGSGHSGGGGAEASFAAGASVARAATRAVI
jgi:hypothetical protein